MRTLDTKNVVVTGSSRVMGEAIAPDLESQVKMLQLIIEVNIQLIFSIFCQWSVQGPAGVWAFERVYHILIPSDRPHLSQMHSLVLF